MAKLIWQNGKFIPEDTAMVHISAHALHYGSSVFEGIRVYASPQGPAVFRLEAHLERLYNSAKIYHLPIPYEMEILNKACLEIINRNQLKTAYIRPLVYRGPGPLGLLPDDRKNPVEVAIMAMEWGSYLGKDALVKGVSAGVSSWQRLAPNTMPMTAKAGGNYLSSQLIAAEARRHGYDEGIALDTRGFLSEGPGENIFLVRDGALYTPPLTASILPGITRDSLIKIAKHLHIPVYEQDLVREGLYLADELFFTGTAAEIAPITSVDGFTIGKGVRGPLTTQLQNYFFGLFSGTTPDLWHWLTFTEQK